MSKTKENIILLIWMTPMLFFCGFIIQYESRLNNCYGLFQTLSDLVQRVFLVVFLLVFLIIQIYKIRKHSNIKKTRIMASLFLIIVTIIASQGRATWRKIHLRNNMLKASIHKGELDIARLELIDNEKYYALYGHIDWSCGFTEKYEIIGDTLILSGNPIKRSDSIIANKYIIYDSVLVPIKIQNEEINRVKKLIIEKRE